MITNRRKFIKSGAYLVSTTPLFGKTIYSNFFNEKTSGLIEPSRDTPVINETDVIICGGGSAGFAAAISSAQQGAMATIEARDEVNRMVNTLRTIGGSFSGMRIVATGS